MSVSVLRELSWDSQHFGFRVARITASDLADEALEEALALARHEAISLVYWAAGQRRTLPESILAAYSGKLVDWKTTYGADLQGLALGAHFGSPEIVLDELPPGPASPTLLELGIAAGAYSRFRVDRCIGERVADRMYAVWTDRCARRELADAVFVATPARVSEPPRGMVTVREHSGVGVIGLIAVRAEYRGQGLGQRLLDVAHSWMADRAVKRSRVVTQRANEPACRLYQRAGYEIEGVRQIFHFWPLAQELA